MHPAECLAHIREEERTHLGRRRWRPAKTKGDKGRERTIREEKRIKYKNESVFGFTSCLATFLFFFLLPSSFRLSPIAYVWHHAFEPRVPPPLPPSLLVAAEKEIDPLFQPIRLPQVQATGIWHKRSKTCFVPACSTSASRELSHS